MTEQDNRVGWIGAGRMGSAIARRLLDAGTEVWVWNRTKSKTEALAGRGAKVVDQPADLASCDVVFTMVAGPTDVMEVTFGEGGLLTAGDTTPSVLVDSTTIDTPTSAKLRDMAAERGTQVLAAPVSGNPKVVKAGKLTVVASGPREAFDLAHPHLQNFGRGVTYVGDGDQARLVKICHNLMLGTVAQSMAEITMLAEASGVKRSDFLEFLNNSVMGSIFTRYKSPAFVNLDYTPTFTWHLLRKDLELGLDAGRDLDVPLPLAALVHSLVIEGIGLGYAEEDFAALLTKEARASGRELQPENIEFDDGLS
ncbi:MAG TPA: NAD(P)-dependent oxidoreductase [Acidimicrobiia bacterium]|nr:NAD(P)-dependent oxidoreductase [Acidimicrobiia bacterium]